MKELALATDLITMYDLHVIDYFKADSERVQKKVLLFTTLIKIERAITETNLINQPLSRE